MLGREADEAGLLHYMEVLSQGFGKDSILITLMNSAEARRFAGENKLDVAPANSNVLSRELAQLFEAHNKKRFVNRIFRNRRSRVKRKELNALEFRLGSMFELMLSQAKTEILQEITRRSDLHHEVGRPAQNNSRAVNVIQAQRRSVSRPGREG